ncbi:hypothetical protein POF51_29720 [Brevibacillus sp. AG]|uniref:hypothetical protein n=1 Tax=Brevibacillus sp. AG TaxID=3020891 RepID=UPI00232BA073|nr:hypothetical protein [Brevibacillus sp. AG]MDC0764903.1 hypothetical protein [Brevibacillus sp. AG]
MKNNKKVIMFPSSTPKLPHYSDTLSAEAERNQKFIEDVKRRAHDIMQNAKKRDREQ